MAETRDISMHFWATQEEYDLIQKNIALSGSTNLSAFLRKMAIDDMLIRLDMPEIQEMLHLLRRANANINQIARHLHNTIAIQQIIAHNYMNETTLNNPRSL